MPSNQVLVDEWPLPHRFRLFLLFPKPFYPRAPDFSPMSNWLWSSIAIGTLLFLILHSFKQLQSPYDCYWVTLLLSLDSQVAFRYWVWRRANR